MKIALVCDDLVQHGGHENVVMEFCKVFPQAPLFTTMATKEWQDICREENIELNTSFMQKLPFKKGLNRYYAPFLLYMVALENFNFDDFDVVISLSSRFAHGIITKPSTLHVCYMSTVGRMFWEPKNYFAHVSFWGISFFKKLANSILSLPLSYIRVWDKTAAQRPDHFITISKTSRSRIHKYYQRDAVIINPPVDIDMYTKEVSSIPNDYLLIATRLVPWKRVDIAIKACLDLGLKLKIMGSGPDLPRLKSLSGGSELIEFLGYVSEDEKVKYMKNCQALILTQLEDFGLTPVEVMACGRPVIAYAKGGVLETVLPGETGEFYEQQTAASLKKILQEFDHKTYDKDICLAQAAKFDLPRFEDEIRDFLTKVKRSPQAE